jgi:hypothetical protein
MSTQKIASATLYVQEELSDARLRCDELKNHIMKAIEFVNASGKRDHIYSVAGDIVLAIPETLMKMEKALEAAALAMNKIDYEELRLGLRPEKVDELERVLDSVRMNIPRRTGMPLMTERPGE